MIYIYEVHCRKCKINIKIETDEKQRRRPRCRKCNSILIEGYLEEENK